MNAVILDAELGDCESLPADGLKETDSGVVRIETTELRVPERFHDALKTLDHKLTVDAAAHSLRGQATFGCQVDAVRYSIDFVFGGQPAHVDAWVATEEDDVEVELLGWVGRHHYAAALNTSPDGVNGVVVSTHVDNKKEFGWRTVMESDGEFASGYIQHLKGSPLLASVPDAFSVRIDGEEFGAVRNCHLMEDSSERVFKSGDCDDLPLSQPLDSVFEAGYTYSLARIAGLGGPETTFVP